MPLQDASSDSARRVVKRRSGGRIAESRKRSVVACDVCRQQKEKCEGGPPCRRCVRLRRECQFQNSTFRRTSQVPVRDDVENVQSSRIKDLERIAEHFIGDIGLDDSSIRQTASDIARLSQDSTAASEQQAQNGGENGTVESFDTRFVSKVTAHYSGEFSHWNFSQKLWRWVSHRLENLGINNLNQRIHVKDYWRPTQLQSPATIIHQTMAQLPPHHIAKFLVKLFFKYVQLNCFYIEEEWIYSKLQQCYVENPEFSAGDVSWACSLFAILAIGTQMAHMESGKELLSEASEDLSLCSEDEVGKVFFHNACKLVPDVITLASQESVQACLLLATYAMPLSTGGLSYTYLGLSMNMIILNGMHRKYAGAGCDAKTIETRNRLFWTAYTLERYVSAMHGRPVSIARLDISADLPTDFPGLRSPNYNNLMAFIELNDGLFDCAEALKQFRRCPKALFPECAARLLQVRTRIKTWWDELPGDTKCENLEAGEPSFRANAHLKLCYLLIFIYIGRPFFFTENHKRSPVNPPLQTVHSSGISALVDEGVQAALQIIDLLESLSKHVGLSRASYTEFSSCRASLLMLLTESFRSDQWNRTSSALEQGMNLIRRMTGGNSNQSEVSLIEYLARAIKHISAARQENGAQDNTSTSRELADAYANFKSWAQIKKNGSAVKNPFELSSLSSTAQTISPSDTQAVSIDAADLLNTTWSFSEEDAEFDPFMFTLVPET